MTVLLELCAESRENKPNCNMSRASVRGMSLSIMSHDEIIKRSEVEITETTVYRGTVPVAGGVCDPRMGSTHASNRCTTCGNTNVACPGHPGHIEFAVPLYSYTLRNETLKLLRSICLFCNRVMLREDESGGEAPRTHSCGSRDAQRRTSSILVSGKCGVCPHQDCEARQPQYSLCGAVIMCKWIEGSFDEMCERQLEIVCQMHGFDVLPEYGVTYAVPASHVWDDFHTTSNKSYRKVGFDPDTSHPENFVLRSMLVPPLTMRPSTVTDVSSGSTGEDPITMSVLEVVRRNVSLKNKIASFKLGEIDHEEVSESIRKLQDTVSLYQNCTATVSTGTHRRPSTCAQKRMNGKGGEIRSRMVGKRVNFSARASACSLMHGHDIDTVGIPASMAVRLTVSERVCNLNLGRLSRRVNDQDPNSVHGASTVVFENGRRINLKYRRSSKRIKLTDSCLVERPLQNGDYVVVNRQPSLHRGSMMGFRVVLVPGNAIRMHASNTGPFNLDFDGDELNIHAPQTEEAAVEVRHIMSNVQNARATKGLGAMGVLPIQDSISACYLMTEDRCVLDNRTLSRVMLRTFYPNWRIYQEEVVNRGRLDACPGRIALSIINPDGLLCNFGDFRVLDGVIQAGSRFTKGSVRKIAVTIERDFGTEVYIRWLSDFDRVVNEWLLTYGITVGLADCMLSQNGRELVKCNLEKSLSGDCKLDLLAKNYPSVVPKLRLDELKDNLVGNVSAACVPVVESFLRGGNDNGMLQSIRSGAKGNAVNIMHVSGFVGQCLRGGNRLRKLCDSIRVSPNYTHYDYGILSSGFIPTSLVQGLRPHQFFQLAIPGRQSLCDTAIRTSETGYAHRKMSKLMSNVDCRNDGTVRTSETNSKIVSMLYGGDGMDPRRMEMVCSPPTEPQAVQDHFGYSSQFERVEPVFGQLYRSVSRSGQFARGWDVQKAEMCTDPERWAQRMLSINTSGRLLEREEIWDKLLSAQLKIESITSPWVAASFIATMHWSFEVERLFGNVDALNLEWAVNGLVLMYESSMIDPGDMCGCAAAQSVGEFFTQSTLNTQRQVNSSASGSRRSTHRATQSLGGIARVHELMALQTPSRPLVWFGLDDDFDEQRAHALASKLERLLVKDVVVMNTACIDDEHVVVRLCEQTISDYQVSQQKLLEVVSTALDVEDLTISNGCLKVKFDNLPTFVRLISDLLVHGVPYGIHVTVRNCIRSGFSLEMQSTLSKVLESGVHADLNITNVMSNDPKDVCKHMGIGAARVCLARELYEVLTMDGAGVSFRHVLTIVDKMSCHGSLRPANRFGMTGDNYWVFEEAHRNLMRDAIYSYESKGSTENQVPSEEQGADYISSVIFGSRMRRGTGYSRTVTKKHDLGRKEMETYILSNVRNKERRAVVTTRKRSVGSVSTYVRSRHTTKYVEIALQNKGRRNYEAKSLFTGAYCPPVC